MARLSYKRSAYRSENIFTQPGTSAYMEQETGKACYLSERYTEAVDAFLRSIELEPREISNYHWLGRSYEKLGQVNTAIDSYKNGLKLNKLDFPILQTLGSLLYNEKRYREAIPVYELLDRLFESKIRQNVLLMKSTEYLDIKQRLGRMYLELGNTTQALTHLNPVMFARPQVTQSLLAHTIDGSPLPSNF